MTTPVSCNLGSDIKSLPEFFTPRLNTNRISTVDVASEQKSAQEHNSMTVALNLKPSLLVVVMISMKGLQKLSLRILN